jgi:hypothetical protein
VKNEKLDRNETVLSSGTVWMRMNKRLRVIAKG